MNGATPGQGSPHEPRLSAGRLALLLGGGIFCLATLGIFAVPVHGEPGRLLRWFDLDRELNVVTLFSSGLLIANGWLVAHLVKNNQFQATAILLAGVFVFMGLDEALKIHETLEKWLEVDWQILYLPVFAVAGLGWLYVFVRNRGLTRGLWVMGAAGWVLSQLLEAGQWGWWWSDGSSKASNYNFLMVTEEVMEMSGSALFLLALFRLCWPDGLILPWRRRGSLAP